MSEHPSQDRPAQGDTAPPVAASTDDAVPTGVVPTDAAPTGAAQLDAQLGAEPTGVVPTDAEPIGAAPAAAEATILPGAAILGLEADDAPAALRALSARLREIGAVTGTFEAAVLLREEKHPTGLPTLVPAAVPHTDPEHVITPGFAIAVPTFPVAFGEVGSQGERRIWAELVIMLVLSDATGQAAALQSLVAKLQEPETVRDMLDATDDADLERRARAWLAG